MSLALNRYDACTRSSARCTASRSKPIPQPWCMLVRPATYGPNQRYDWPESCSTYYRFRRRPVHETPLLHAY